MQLTLLPSIQREWHSATAYSSFVYKRVLRAHGCTFGLYDIKAVVKGFGTDETFAVVRDLLALEKRDIEVTAHTTDTAFNGNGCNIFHRHGRLDYRNGAYA